jgi:hypothetical protein
VIDHAQDERQARLWLQQFLQQHRVMIGVIQCGVSLVAAVVLWLVVVGVGVGVGRFMWEVAHR